MFSFLRWILENLDRVFLRIARFCAVILVLALPIQIYRTGDPLLRGMVWPTLCVSATLLVPAFRLPHHIAKRLTCCFWTAGLIAYFICFVPVAKRVNKTASLPAPSPIQDTIIAGQRAPWTP